MVLNLVIIALFCQSGQSERKYKILYWVKIALSYRKKAQTIIFMIILTILGLDPLFVYLLYLPFLHV